MEKLSLKKRPGRSKIVKTETVEEFLARGGKITKVDPPFESALLDSLDRLEKMTKKAKPAKPFRRYPKRKKK